MAPLTNKDKILTKKTAQI